MAASGFDCVQIPGAAKQKTATAMVPSRFCGRSSGLVTAVSGNSINPAATVCSEYSAIVP